VTPISLTFYVFWSLSNTDRERRLNILSGCFGICLTIDVDRGCSLVSDGKELFVPTESVFFNSWCQTKRRWRLPVFAGWQGGCLA
jgi:hypothetical protein